MIDELCVYFICFIVFGFIGWLYECVFYSSQLKKPVNSGFLKGCVCPVYGFGGLLLMAFSGEVKSYAVLFLSGIIVCSLLEYFVSWLLEYLFDRRWWDYSDWPLNINGRICVVSMLGFGFAAIIGTRIIIPLTLRTVTSMPPDRITAVAAIMALLFIADIIYTLHSLDSDSKQPWFIEEHSKLMEERNRKLTDKITSIKDTLIHK